ncbi:hypothetical protein MP478_12090 [Chryseobacterium sp. WG14]|uniref:hypothetical protein n=1 Tax=unclassified Chryseobacterium TaxID=2593645 RepID=UPI00211E5567|nr:MULTISPECIES: hypothetical protein [unclassified Chryseobacterium]MCQ9634773.1 hypothetical protein [Chryseobacterium sp. WG23]MCQ9640119.1 hypothetical protein [Chryseobacterium sp. WG14]
MKNNPIILKIFIIILLLVNRDFNAQNLSTEMFTNQNSIDSHFVADQKIKKLFPKNEKKLIQLIIKTDNDSIHSIYIKNNQNKNIQLIPQDNSLYLIQEALTKDKQWQPIEFWGYSTCGNSYDKTMLFFPQQIIRLSSRRYSGEFQTRIRFKLLLDKQVYYSNSVRSAISPEKFKKSKWFNEIKEMYGKYNTQDIENKLFLNTSL